MNLRSKSARAIIALVSLFVFWTANEMNRVLVAGGSQNGAAGQMPAFHDGEEITINIYQLSATAAAAAIAKNPSVNKIFASSDLDKPQQFIPVINAIQGQGFNPLWQQFFIVFNAGFTPHQFHSAQDIEAAAAGADPEITLVDTGELYRCSVVGNK